MTLDLSQRLFANLAATGVRHPSRLAFTFLHGDGGTSNYTFAELFERARVIAGNLARHRLPEHAPIGILVENQETQVLHYLAALSLGLTPAILTPPNRKMNRGYYLETMDAVLAYCRFAAVITDVDDFAPAVAALAPYALHASGALPDRDARAPRTAAFVQFSSGTTGVKRGVVVSDDAALSQLDAYGRAIGLAAEDCIVSWLPLYHDMGFIACLNLPLAYGVHTVMMQPMAWVADPTIYLRAVHRYRATLGWNPNFAYAFMAERVDERNVQGIDLSSLRGLVNCSEPVTLASQQRFVDRFAPLGCARHVFWGCYAMAETTFALTHGRSDEPDYFDRSGQRGAAVRPGAAPSVSVGRPLPGVELRIIADNGRRCAEHEVGELAVRSPFNFCGYYNNPEQTRIAVRDGWYATGDLGYEAAGRFFVCGRKKDVVIVAGANLYPQDVEETVSRLGCIKAGRVVAFAAFDDALQTERLVVLAEADAASDARALVLSEIRQRLQAAFNVTNLAVELVPPGWLVKSSAGKIARSTNREQWLKGNTSRVPLDR